MKTAAGPNIMDIEASGFGAHSYPVEIGVIKSNGDRFCSLIKPIQEWTHWSEEAEAVHGISRNNIEKCGRSIKDVCNELNTFLGTCHVFSDALSHDERWLRKLFSAANILPQFQIRAIEYILCEKQVEIWDETKKAVQQKLNIQRHRASSDAMLIQQTFLDSHAALAQLNDLDKTLTRGNCA